MEIEEACDINVAERHHLTLVSSGMPCLAWVMLPEPLPLAKPLAKPLYK